MSRRRRRKLEKANLFAFQDVMAAVIGVLFFVVLLLALNMVNASALAAGDAADAPSEAQLEAMRDSVAGLKEEVAKVDKAARAAAGKTEKVVLGGEAAALAELIRLNASLKALYKAIKKTEDEQRKKVEDKLAPKVSELKRRQQQLRQLETEISKVKQTIREARARPRVSYILQTGPDARIPWLVELSGSRIRVAPKDGGSTVLAIDAENHASRAKVFFAWASRQSARTHYFVLLIKPSAAAYAYPFGRRLRKMGFQIGTDLLPEGWRVFE